MFKGTSLGLDQYMWTPLAAAHRIQQVSCPRRRSTGAARNPRVLDNGRRLSSSAYQETDTILRTNVSISRCTIRSSQANGRSTKKVGRRAENRGLRYQSSKATAGQAVSWAIALLLDPWRSLPCSSSCSSSPRRLEPAYSRLTSVSATADAPFPWVYVRQGSAHFVGAMAYILGTLLLVLASLASLGATKGIRVRSMDPRARGRVSDVACHDHGHDRLSPPRHGARLCRRPMD
jgi:hypothetical protein